MRGSILVINAGSSSLKFSVFDMDAMKRHFHGEIEQIQEKPILNLFDDRVAAIKSIRDQSLEKPGYEFALDYLLKWLKEQELPPLRGVGHRVVHGGSSFFLPTLIDDTVLAQLKKLIPLAPLHQPHNLEPIPIIKKLHPKLKQVACFDTAFHRTQPRLATLFGLPRALTNSGIIRYGFHGLSYEYISFVMPQFFDTFTRRKIIVAHLGQGASLCALKDRKSIATSMGFTALDGLIMGSRCGNLDPGVVLHLMQTLKMMPDQINHLLYQHSGLLGISGISADMRALLSSDNPNAKEAIDLFCYRAAREIGSLITALEGCDAIIFTAGIGENAPLIRQKIMDQFQWLGISIQSKANEANETLLTPANAAILVAIIPTNEELMIARHTKASIPMDV